MCLGPIVKISTRSNG